MKKTPKESKQLNQINVLKNLVSRIKIRVWKKISMKRLFISLPWKGATCTKIGKKISVQCVFFWVKGLMHIF